MLISDAQTKAGELITQAETALSEAEVKAQAIIADAIAAAADEKGA